MLDVKNIHSYYGESHVLQGLSLEVSKGEIVCLLGRNGAGKSTTMKSIMGIVVPREGSVLFKGKDVTKLPPHKKARMGIAYVPEDRRVFPELTVEENLEVAYHAAKRERKWDPKSVFEAFPILKKLKERKAGNLSGGEQQVLVIARALVTNPELVLLDEPCEGLAPVIVEELERIIKGLKGEVTILLAEQNARFALSVSDRGYVIEKGKMVFSGSSHELASNEEVQKRYLAV